MPKYIRTGRTRTLTITGNMMVQGVFTKRVTNTVGVGGGTSNGYVMLFRRSHATVGNSGYDFSGLNLYIGGYQGEEYHDEFVTSATLYGITGIGNQGMVLRQPLTVDEPPPAAPGEINFGAPTVLTATATYSIIFHLREWEEVDTSSRRRFIESIDPDLDSVRSATLEFGGLTTSASDTVRGFDYSTGIGTGDGYGSGGIDALSYQASCSAVAGRRAGREYSGSYPYKFREPAHTLAASATAVNTCAGCDYALDGSPSASSPFSSAANGAVTASTPPLPPYDEDAIVIVGVGSQASYVKRVYKPRTITRGKCRRRLLDGTVLPAPYTSGGAAFWGWQGVGTSTVMAALDTTKPDEIEVVTGEGVGQAYAVTYDIYSDDTPEAETHTIYLPFADRVIPPGVHYGPQNPSLCTLINGYVGSTSANGFVPEGSLGVYRNISRSPSLSGLTISQADFVAIAASPFLSGGRFGGAWSAGGGVALSESSGRLVITGGSAAGLATLTFAAPVAVGYRFLRVRVSATSATAVSVRVANGSLYDGSVSASLAVGDNDIWVDLLRITRTVNTVVPSDADVATLRLATVEIGVAANASVSVEYIRFERRGQSSLSILDGLPTGTGAVNGALPGFAGFTDGMPTRCIHHARTVPDTAIPDLLGTAELSQQTGWQGTYTGPATAAERDKNDLDESYPLHGVIPLRDLPVGASLVRFGRLGHGVIGYHGCGDVLNAGAYGEMVVEYDDFVGAEMTATVVGDGFTPAVTTVRDSDGAELSTRLFGGSGLVRYAALAPVITASGATRTASSIAPVSVVSGLHGVFEGAVFRWNAPQRTRAWFALIFGEADGLLSADVSGSGRSVVSYTELDTVRLLFRGGAVVNTGIVAPESCVRFLEDDAILLVTARNGVVSRRVTRTEGRSFSMATTIFSSGGTPTVALAPHGVEVHFCQTAAGSVLTKVLSATGVVMIPETVVVAGGVSARGLAAYERYGRIHLVYRTDAGLVREVSSVNLKTYT